MKRYLLIVILSLACMVQMYSQSADLQLEMSVDNQLAAIDQTVVFTIVLFNNGPDQATGITVQDRLPSGFELERHTTTLGVFAPAAGIWTIGGIDPGDSARLTLHAKVIGAGDNTNTAEVLGSGLLDYDSTPNNGVDTDGDGNVVDDPDDEDDGDGQVVIVGGSETSSGSAAASGPCLAPTNVASNFTPNPIDPVNSIFKFDYRIEAVANFEFDEENFNPEYSMGNPKELIMDYYVNSADGSILFTGGSTGFFGTNFQFDDALGRVDAAVWLANGQMVVFGYDAKEDRLVAVTRESAQTGEGRWANDYVTMKEFFKSTEEWAAIPEPAPPQITTRYGNTVGYRGKMIEAHTGLTNTWKLYFDTTPTPITTSPIITGFMVGVLKDDQIAKCNRLLVYTKVLIGGEDSGESMEIELKKIVPAGITFDGKEYQPLKVGGDYGTQAQIDMSSYESRMRDLEVNRQFLRREREGCRDRACLDRVDGLLEENRMARSRLICESMVAMGMESSMAECMSKEE